MGTAGCRLHAKQTSPVLMGQGSIGGGVPLASRHSLVVLRHQCTMHPEDRCTNARLCLCIGLSLPQLVQDWANDDAPVLSARLTKCCMQGCLSDGLGAELRSHKVAHTWANHRHCPDAPTMRSSTEPQHWIHPNAGAQERGGGHVQPERPELLRLQGPGSLLSCPSDSIDIDLSAAAQGRGGGHLQPDRAWA